MTSKNPENKKKTQSKLSFYEKFFAKPIPTVTENTKENTETKNPTSHSDVNNKDLILFKDITASDMEVDTTINKQQPESEAKSSTAKPININVNEDSELLLPL